MLIADIIRVIGSLLYMTVQSPSVVWLMYVIIFVQSSLGGFFDTCRGSMIPSLVPKRDELVAANTIDGVGL